MASTEPVAEPATASGCIGTKLAPFNPSDPQVVEAALELLALTAADRFYDLGCGDGRLLVAAAKSAGCACEGVEYDARWAAAAQAAAAASGLPDIAVVHGNALDTDLSGMTACFVYLCPAGMKELAPRFFARLAAGARIVTYMFSIPGAAPAATRTLRSCPVRLYDASSVPPPPPPPPPPPAALSSDDDAEAGLGFFFDSHGETAERKVECGGLRLRVVSLLDTESGALQSGHYVWPAALWMARWVARDWAALTGGASGVRVVELGCGCGVAGMAAALQPTCAAVAFTDHDPGTLKLVERSLAATGGRAANAAAVAATTHPLEWGAEAPLGGDGGFGLVLGSDLVYDIGVVDPLFDTASALLAPGARFALAFSFVVGADTEAAIAAAAARCGLAEEAEAPFAPLLALADVSVDGEPAVPRDAAAVRLRAFRRPLEAPDAAPLPLEVALAHLGALGEGQAAAAALLGAAEAAALWAEIDAHVAAAVRQGRDPMDPGDAISWNARYMRMPKAYEWYCGWDRLRPIVEAAVPAAGGRTLVLGNGNSDMPLLMAMAGVGGRVVATDIAHVATRLMRARAAGLAAAGVSPALLANAAFETVDGTARCADFADGAFDVAVDKGTLDTLLCSGKDAKTSAYLAEAARLLKPGGGTLLLFSYGVPDTRTPLLERSEFGWAVSAELLPPAVEGGGAKGKSKAVYLYTCVRGLS